MNKLYLLPAIQYAPDQLKGIVQSLPVRSWCYFGTDTSYRMAVEQALAGNVPWFSIAELLDKISRQLRQPFLELIGDLTGRNGSPLWWGSGLANKNPYTSSLFLQCCFLMVGRDLCSEVRHGDRLLVVESPALLRQLTIIATEGGAPMRHLGSLRSPLHRLLGRNWSALRNWRWMWVHYLRRRAVLRRHGMLEIRPFTGPNAALLFTWIDWRSFARDGSYCDPHFGDPLAQHLRSRGYRLAYISRVLPTIHFEEAVRCLRLSGEACLFPEALLTPADMSGTILRSTLYRPVLPRPICLEGVDVTKLVDEQVEQDVEELASNVSYYSLVRQLARHGVAPSLVFYTMEGHSWERVLCQGVRDYLHQTQTVACNTGTFTPMLLCVYPSQKELECLPLPDWIVSNGPQLKAILEQAGYPGSRVLAGADLRRKYLWDYPALIERPVRNRDATVLVATEIGLNRSVELVDKALRALAGRAGYQVIVKWHPMVDPRRVAALVGEGCRAENVRFTTVPVAELLSQADILLYTYTSVCFEALRYGVAPVFVRAESWLNMDQLENAPECRWIATSPEEIRTAVEEVLSLSDAAWRQWYQHAQEVLAQHLAPIIPELLDRFVDFPPRR